MAKPRPAPDFLTWRNETRKLSELVPWDRNPRQIKDAEARRLGESLLQFGQVQTLAISPEGEIYDGHQRALVWSLLQEGGDREVDVRVSSRALTEKEREKLVVYLHRGAHGEWDFEALANGFDFDELVEWGFNENELGLFQSIIPDDFKEVDENIDTEHECPKCGYRWSGGK